MLARTALPYLCLCANVHCAVAFLPQEARVAELANTIRSSSGSDSKMRPSVMFVDGYNILYADSQLVNIANVNLALARAELEKRCGSSKRVDTHTHSARCHLASLVPHC